MLQVSTVAVLVGQPVGTPEGHVGQAVMYEIDFPNERVTVDVMVWVLICCAPHVVEVGCVVETRLLPTSIGISAFTLPVVSVVMVLMGSSGFDCSATPSSKLGLTWVLTKEKRPSPSVIPLAMIVTPRANSLARALLVVGTVRTIGVRTRGKSTPWSQRPFLLTSSKSRPAMVAVW